MLFFFFNDTATTEIYTLSLHDALPIYHVTVVLDDFYVDRLVAIAVTILEVKHAFGLLSYRSTTRKDYFVEVIAVVIEAVTQLTATCILIEEVVPSIGVRRIIKPIELLIHSLDSLQRSEERRVFRRINGKIGRASCRERV